MFHVELFTTHNGWVSVFSTEWKMFADETLRERREKYKTRMYRLMKTPTASLARNGK